MDNKVLIKKLRDNAELAWVSYGYFHLLKDNKGIPRKRYALDEQGNKITDNSYLRGYKEIEVTFADILNIKLNGQEVLINQTASNKFLSNISNKFDDTFNFDKLDGDFSPLQAKRFFERYKLVEHCPNTSSGFSATLFEDLGEIDKSTGERKEVPKDSKYILAFRGTEMGSDKIKAMLKDFYEDFLLGTNQIPEQYFDLIHFVETEIKPRIYDTSSQSYPKMMIVGHSLGGFLAQMCALSYDELVNEVYTYNAPGIFNDETKKIWDDIKTNAFAIFLYLYGTKKSAEYITSLFQSKTNIKPYAMLDIGKDKELYCGMLEMNNELLKRIKSYQTNSRGLLEIIDRGDSATQKLKNTIPYFLRIDQEAITLEESKYTYIRKVFSPNSMREYAKQLYNTLQDKIKIYQGKTFYVYYAYAFSHTTTQAQIS
ncbi:hypothetical protein CQA53_11210, partial [Helicobacter didelphidarum]